MRASPPLLLALACLSCGPPADPGDQLQGAAQLQSLSLSGLVLSPPFDPAVHDYAVRCAAGATRTTVRAAGAEGAPVTLLAPGGSLGTPLDLEEGALVVVGAGESAGARTYVRCLPHDFPPLQVTLHPENGDPAPGWYLLGTPVMGTGSTSYAMVLDQRGTPVWFQRADSAMDLEALGPDLLVLTPYLPVRAGESGTYSLLHLDSGQTETVSPVPGLPLDPHEVRLLPDGSRVGLAVPLVPGVDLTGLYGWDAGTTLADCVVEVRDPAGRLTWSWRASEHLDPVTETTVDYPAAVEGRPVADVFHCNSVEDDGEGGFLVSARHLDAVLRVDRGSGRVSWKLGGAPTNRDGARILRFVGDPNGGFYRQHDARLGPGGRLEVFDDESRFDRPARAVEYALDLDAGTATLTFAYPGPGPSAAMGSHRYLADGSRVVGWGWLDGPLTLTELNPAGAPVLELGFTDGSHAYRSLKAAPEVLRAERLRSF